MASVDQSPGATGGARRSDPAAIAVVSDRSLVAEAVGAALSGDTFVAVQLPWPVDPGGADAQWTPGPHPPERALMLCDLEQASLDSARWVVMRYPSRWLLLTDAPRGPLWGAMLEAGVAVILRSTTTTAELMEAIAALGEGSGDIARADRDELVAEWRRYGSERTVARARLSSLTRREREVLRLLHLGCTVRQIAEYDAVAPSTVRSHVRSVLRKLELNSQLAAAAYFEKWGRA